MISAASLVNLVPYQVYDAWVTSSQAPGALKPVPPTAAEGTGLDIKAFQNLGYTGEWFVFAGFVIFMWFRLFRREAETARDLALGITPPEPHGLRRSRVRTGPQMTPSELDLQAQLLDPLLDDQRAVPRVIAVDLMRGAALLEPLHIVVDLPYGAAGVVQPRRDVDRRPHLIHIGQRGRRLEPLRHLLRGAAQQGAVHRLQGLHLVVVGRHIVRDRDRGQPQRPGIRLGPDPQQRQIAAP